MKILEIIPQLSQGGAERFVVDLCNELVLKNEVFLIILHNIDKAGFFVKEINPDVKIITMNKRSGMDFSLFFRLYKCIKQINPDVVHTHLRAIVYSFFAYLRHSNIKFIHTVHNDAHKEAGIGISKWCRFFAFRTRRVIPVTISEESQRSFVDLYNINPPLIYNGRPVYKESAQFYKVHQELDKLKSYIDSIVIVNIARISAQKNQLALVKAIQSLNEQGKHLDLFIIGQDVDIIAAEIKQMNCKYIHLLGTRINPRDYIKAADAFCLSSIYEGMPISLIECFSVGTLPICTPVGGIVNMITDGENGILAKSTSVADIEHAIFRFLNMSEKEKIEMRNMSSVSYEKYSMKKCVEGYLNLFKK